MAAFKTSFAIKITYRVNSILYSLRQLPIIKKLLPASLYGVKGLKIFGYVIAAIWEFITAFGGKLVYFGIIWGATQMAKTAGPDAYMHIIFFLTLLGAYSNNYLLAPSKGKYYAVILMRMNAKRSALTDYAYELSKVLIAFTAFGLIAGTMVEAPVWQCLLIPFFAVASKLCDSAIMLARYKKKGDAYALRGSQGVQFVLVLVFFALAGLPLMLGVAIPGAVTAALMVPIILGGIIAIRPIVTFGEYRQLCQQLLLEHMDALQNASKVQKRQVEKQIDTKAVAVSSKKGMEYLNDIFIKRHRKILWKTSNIVSVAAAAIVVVAIGAVLFVVPDSKTVVADTILSKFSVMAFVMYAINRGTSFTQALFMNCDHSLLTYSFFKTPKNILRLFGIRLVEIIKINIVPALIIAAGTDGLLLACGYSGDPIYYALLPLSVVAMSVFFSVHYLTLYYLLQPYNAGTEMKSSTYSLILGATYAVCYLLMTSDITTKLFCMICVVFCVAYSIIACALAYFRAPKTFRLR